MVSADGHVALPEQPCARFGIARRKMPQHAGPYQSKWRVARSGLRLRLSPKKWPKIVDEIARQIRRMV